MEPDASIENEARSSIKVTRGMKGEYGWELKAYCRTDELIELPAQLAGLDREMRKHFGTPS